MFEQIRARFRQLNSPADFVSLRYVGETSETLTVRQNVAEPPRLSVDRGVMITVIDKGGYGYAATSDLSAAGLSAALERAQLWARSTRGRTAVDFDAIDLPQGQYKTKAQYSSLPGSGPVGESIKQRFDLLTGSVDHRDGSALSHLREYRCGPAIPLCDSPFASHHQCRRGDANAQSGRAIQRLLPARKPGDSRPRRLRGKRQTGGLRSAATA